MNLRNVSIALGALLLSGLIGYGAGRYAVPARVEVRTVVQTQTVTEWRDRVVEKVVAGPTRTVTRVVDVVGPCTPAGAPTRETVTVVEAGPVTTTRDTDAGGATTSATVADTRTVTTQEQPRFMLQVGAASGIDVRPAYNVGASYRFAGPLWAGIAYHTTDRRLELRASLTF